MAEEDFQVDRSITPKEREMIAGNARWAETFGAGSTNLAQRARYQDDISKERAVRADEKQAAFDRSLLNKDARDLYFREKAANLAQARTTHDMELRQRKFEMDAERFPLQMDNERLKLQVQQSAMDRALRREARDANIALRSDQQTDSFESSIQGMIDNNINPHSKEFADGLAKAYAKNPYAEKGVVAQWFKNSRIEVSPEDFQAGLSELGGDPKNISVTAGPNGWTFRATPKNDKIDTTIQQDERMLDSLRAKLSDERIQDPDYKEYLKGRIDTIQSRLGGKQQQPSTPAPASAPKLEFQNDPSGFKSAYESAKPGTKLTYNGKVYLKPEAK